MMAVSLLTGLEDMQRRAAGWQRQGRAVGFVATMGALHAGHLSLVRRARAECELVVVSIFVNPKQFGPGEDFERYPRDLEGDRRTLEAEAVDAIFAPSMLEMYPAGATVTVDPGPIGAVLEGALRPGHFVGVATVVAKLFHLVRPRRAYFGQKDAQQLAVIRRLVKDLNFDLEVVACPTVREPDGLALSSRNAYLNPAERRAAPVLYRGLQGAVRAYHEGERDPGRLEAAAQAIVAGEPLARLRYAGCVQPDSFEPARPAAGDTILAVAATIGPTRLIDNTILGGPDRP